MMLNISKPASGPCFEAQLLTENSPGLELPATTLTRVTGWTELRDTHGCFASNRFTPTVAGWYLFQVVLSLDQAPTELMEVHLLQNDGIDGIAHYVFGVPDGNRRVIAGTTVAYANGITDYFDFYCSNSELNNVTETSALNRWHGVFLGP